MSGQRQKNRPEQGVLAFLAESRSEAPKAVEKGTETLVEKRRPESLAETERLGKRSASGKTASRHYSESRLIKGVREWMG